MPGTVYTVASGKGGVGKTTTSVNLAVALWRAGNAVALVDADIGMANLAAVLDLEPEATLHDVLAGRATVDEAVIEAKDGDLMVLPGSRSLDSFAEADPNALVAAVEELADRADYVIVDTGAGLSYEDVLPLGMADGVVLVTTPDPAAFGDTTKTMEVADLLGAPIRGLVVTRAVPDTNSEAIAAEIGAELLGTIPEDPAVMASTVAGDPLESHAPDSDAAAAYRELSETLLSGDEAWLEAHASARVGRQESADSGDVSTGDAATGDDGSAAIDEEDADPGERNAADAESGPPIPEGDEDATDATEESNEAAVDDAAVGEAASEEVDPEGVADGEDSGTEGSAIEDDAAEPTPGAEEADVEDPEADVDESEGEAVDESEEAGADDSAEARADESTETHDDPDDSDDEEAPDLHPREPADIDEEPKTFPAGGVQREGRTTDEEDEAAAADDDAEGREAADGPEDADEVEGEAVDGEEPADGDGGPAAEERRGGLFGWLGRLFS